MNCFWNFFCVVYRRFLINNWWPFLIYHLSKCQRLLVFSAKSNMNWSFRKLLCNSFLKSISKQHETHERCNFNKDCESDFSVASPTNNGNHSGSPGSCTLVICCKDLRQFKLEFQDYNEYLNVSDTLEKLSAIGMQFQK